MFKKDPVSAAELAGELCERFNEILLVHNEKVMESVLTYRGEGKTFL